MLRAFSSAQLSPLRPTFEDAHQQWFLLDPLLFLYHRVFSPITVPPFPLGYPDVTVRGLGRLALTSSFACFFRQKEAIVPFMFRGFKVRVLVSCRLFFSLL